MKKELVALTGVIALAAVCQNVEAKSLEEVLKEKGVITEADLKTVTKQNEYKLGKGLTFTSADEKYSLTINQAFQAQLAHTNYQTPGKTDVTDLNLRRVKTIFSGYAFSKDFTYNASYNMTNLNTANTGSTKAIEEVYINYRFLNELNLLAGQTKVQYSRSWITSFRLQQFVDGSFVRAAFYPGFDTGIYTHGKILDGKLKYNFAWLGGNGQNVKSVDGTNAFNIRLGVDPLGEMAMIESDLAYSKKPLVSFAGSFYKNKIAKIPTTTTTYSGPVNALVATTKTTTAAETNNLGYGSSTGWLGMALAAGDLGTTAENLSINTFEVDMAAKWRGASFTAEYYWGQAKGDTSNKLVVAKGAYAQAGYFIIPQKLEVAMRYNWLNSSIFSKKNTQISELQGGVNYYFYGNNLKLQADVTNRHTYSTVADDLTGRLQLQFIF